jgi:hypothetical protein
MIDTSGRSRLESTNSDFLDEEKKTDTRTFKLEEDFLYGLVTGSEEQEWSVVKYNKKNKGKERQLQIDGFNIKHRKTAENQGFFSSLVPSNLLKGSKNKQKPISQIIAVQRLKENEFKLFYRENKKEVKYKTRNPDDCSEIIAKLKFLRPGQSMNT